MRYLSIFLLIAAVVFSAAACFADDAMTCGTNIVSVGDSKQSILDKCGPPYMKESLSKTGTMERWTYNFGSGSFMKILTFDGDTLDSIEDGDKGFDK